MQQPGRAAVGQRAGELVERGDDEDAASAAGGKRFALRGELLRSGGDSAYGLCAEPGVIAAPFGALRVAAVRMADVHGAGAAEPEARPG